MNQEFVDDGLAAYEMGYRVVANLLNDVLCRVRVKTRIDAADTRDSDSLSEAREGMRKMRLRIEAHTTEEILHEKFFAPWALGRIYGDPYPVLVSLFGVLVPWEHFDWRSSYHATHGIQLEIESQLKPYGVQALPLSHYINALQERDWTDVQWQEYIVETVERHYELTCIWLEGFREPPPSTSRRERKQEALAKAMLIVRDEPHLSNSEIASRVGYDASSLSRWKEFQVAARTARGSKRDIKRGHKTAEGRIEAYGEE